MGVIVLRVLFMHVCVTHLHSGWRQMVCSEGSAWLRSTPYTPWRDNQVLLLTRQLSYSTLAPWNWG